MTVLALKLCLAPTLVVCASLAGRRWGQAVSGILVALPVVAGPILLITDVQHGNRFAAHASAASLLGLVTLALFVVVFARVSIRGSWAAALAAGWGACLAADLAVSRVAVAPLAGLALAIAAAIAGFAAMPATGRPSGHGPAWPRWDLPARAGATALLVLAVTGAAAGLGPTLTGMLAPFPIATSVVAAFVLAECGHGEVVVLLRGVLAGLAGFASFCFLAAVLLVPMHAPGAFALATGAAMSVQLALRMLQGRRRPAEHPAPAAAS